MFSFVIFLCFLSPAHDTELTLAGFSSQPVGEEIEGWERWDFPSIKKKTHYQLVEDSGKIVLRAESKSAASCLGKKIDLETKNFPLLRWRWKVTKAPSAADLRQKKSDDSPARILVGFGGKTKAPRWTLCYLWANRCEKETWLKNPSHSSVMQIVLRNGESKRDEWFEEERNLLEDFKKAFDREAPPVTSVAFMSDTDNTESEAIAFFGDLRASKAARRP